MVLAQSHSYDLLRLAAEITANKKGALGAFYIRKVSLPTCTNTQRFADIS